MIIKRAVSFISALALSVSALLAISMPMASASVNNCTWTGVASNNFNNAGNWDDCNDGVPQDGDSLTFPGISVAGFDAVTINNDISGLSVSGITVGANTGGSYKTYIIAGNSLTVTGDIMINQEGASITAPIVLGNDVALAGLGRASLGAVDTAGHALSLTNSASCGVSLGALSGSGAVQVIGAQISLTQDASNYTGAVSLTNGILSVDSAQALGDTSGVVVSGTSSMGFDLQTIHNVTYSFPLTLGGTGFSTNGYGFSVLNSQGLVGCSGAGGDPSTTYTATFTGPVTLTSDITFAGWDNMNVTGTYTNNGHTITVAGGSHGSITTPAGTSEAPTETHTVAAGDNQPSSFVNISNNQTYIIDGVRGQTNVNSGGILKGSGTVGDLYVYGTGIVAPGHSPGCLNTGNLELNGVYQVELGGTTPCTGYDQLKVTGTVSINNTSTTGAIQVTLYNGFVPKVGQSYTVIDNDGSDAVTGTFNGIAEGGTYTNQGVTYTVTYQGGDGNDVVLTVKSIDASQLPKSPNTGMRLVAAHPLVSIVITTLAAAGIVLIARRLNVSTKR